jgi:ABC-type sugar transport system substrate-binding protein
MNEQHPRFSTLRRSQRLVAGAAAALALAAVAACSSGSSNNSGNGSAQSGGDAACAAKADAFLKKWDRLPTALPAYYAPLSKPPATGKMIIRLVGIVPSDNDSYNQQAQAAATIGWTAKKIHFDGTVEDLNAKFEEAISNKPAVIALSGWPVASIQKPLEDAKKAGIVVVLSSVADDPDSNPGFAAGVNGSATVNELGELHAYMFMRASQCTGHAAIFSLPFPILKIGTDSFTATVKAQCSNCDVSYNEVQSKTIGTPALTGAIVSKLQSDPKVKYVYTVIGNVAVGLDTALSQARITGVSVFGQVPDDNAIKALRERTNAWWLATGTITAWVEFDAALRAMDSGKTVADTGNYPLAILTPKNVPGGTGVPVVPTDYKQEFAKAWQGK